MDTEQIYIEIGKRVREARRNKHLTQERLAEIVSVTRTSITNIEKGRQKLLVHSLYNLASALGVHVNYLLPETVEKGNLRMPPDLSNEEEKWVKSVMEGGEKYGSKNKKKRN